MSEEFQTVNIDDAYVTYDIQVDTSFMISDMIKIDIDYDDPDDIKYQILNDYTHEFCIVKDIDKLGELIYLVSTFIKYLLVEINDINVYISDNTYHCEDNDGYSSGDVDAVIKSKYVCEIVKNLIKKIPSITYKKNI